MGKPPPIMPATQAQNFAQSSLSQHSLQGQEWESCTQGRVPERYSRNAQLTSPAQQAMLLRGRVLLVGLGGLGGHVLDALIRMGVGHITGVDGDSFETSNLNRQLLCNHDTLGMPKVQAAAAHVARVNPATHFVPVARFVRGTEWQALVRGAEMPPCAPHTGAEGIAPEIGPEIKPPEAPPKDGYDLVVDALGGLDDRADLHAATQAAGIPLITAGIAGLTGWVQLVRPSEKSPMQYFSQDTPSADPTDPPVAATGLSPSPSAEALLGNLAPTVCVAAGLQCAQVYALLTGAQPPNDMLVFDLQDLFFSTLHRAEGRKK